MDTNLKTALLVLVVGMITVFIVLCLVVITGRVLIYLVNKYGPESKKNRIKHQDFAPLLNSSLSTSKTLDKKKLAAIISTVEVITQGRGKVVNIEKISSTNK